MAAMITDDENGVVKCIAKELTTSGAEKLKGIAGKDFAMVVQDEYTGLYNLFVKFENQEVYEDFMARMVALLYN